MNTKTFIIAVLLLFQASFSYAAPYRIVVLGDSLVAGYGLAAGEDYPSQLQEALRKDGLNVNVDNAGVSGDTTAGGLARLDWAISGTTKPNLVIISLGANDMLRGINPAITEKNLRTILELLQTKEIPVLLYGMRSPLNMPQSYRNAFDNLFEKLSHEFHIPLYPFFLDGVAANPQLNLEDGIHPNKQGVSLLVHKTLPFVKKALRINK